MNKSDSERIAANLENKGYQPASKIDEADLIVVNMCSVRQSAVDRIYGKIRDFAKLKAQNPKLKTILTGCILKKDEKKLKEIFDDLRRQPWFDSYVKLKHVQSPKIYIPISNGCNNSCTYCVVPHTRGPLICRDHREILKEAREAIRKNIKEIWLLGQNVNDYASPADPKIGFSQLLGLVDGIPGNFWFRFTSPHPKYFSKNLIGALARCQKFARYLNLPVQSGDDRILKKMNRPYTAEQYKNLVKKIRREIPDIALSTDVIVGFSGETERQFQNTAKLMQEVKFDMAYIAKYSKRPGTAAEKMEDNVPHQEKKRREKVLTEILKQTALEKNKKYIGKIVDVLAEKRKRESWIGKSNDYKTVKFESNQNLAGNFVQVKILAASPWGLKGELVKKK